MAAGSHRDLPRIGRIGVSKIRPSIVALGFGMGGFFDGILLHQVLQWHHLLSAVGPTDIRLQIAADGIFHGAMYLVVAVALWRLHHQYRRGSLQSGARVTADFVLGFGIWHVVDAVASHWLLGIHRIRMDSANPLVWDIAWLVAFGLLPLLAASKIRRRPTDLHLPPVIMVLTAGSLLGAAIGSLPPRGTAFTTALFAPGTDPREIMSAISAVEGRIVGTDGTGEVVVLAHSGEVPLYALYLHGALLVSGTGLPAGCAGNLRL